MQREQAGFRKGRSFTDQVFVLKQILHVEQSNGFNETLHFTPISSTLPKFLTLSIPYP